MESAEAKSTAQKNASDGEKQKQVVKIPVSVSIVVPVEVDVFIPEEKKTPDENLDCCIVDPTECHDAANAAIIAMNSSQAACKAFDGLTSAAMRFKEAFPEVDVYLTPFAGLIPEQKL